MLLKFQSLLLLVRLCRHQSWPQLRPTRSPRLVSEIHMGQLRRRTLHGQLLLILRLLTSPCLREARDCHYLAYGVPLKPHLDGSVLSSGPLFYANDAQNTAVTATGKLLVSGVVESVLFDTGAGRSCMATDTAARMLQRGQARAV